MSLSIAATFAKASLALRSCGGWFCSGRNLNLPVMEVYKKPLRFPVSVTNYEQLTDYYQKYKKASFDLSDLPASWQSDADDIQFHSTWSTVLNRISYELKLTHGVDCSLRFDRMCVPNECYSTSHKDVFRDKNHISNLLISLPTQSGFDGGVLEARGPSSVETIR